MVPEPPVPEPVVPEPVLPDPVVPEVPEPVLVPPDVSPLPVLEPLPPVVLEPLLPEVPEPELPPPADVLPPRLGEFSVATGSLKLLDPHPAIASKTHPASTTTPSRYRICLLTIRLAR